MMTHLYKELVVVLSFNGIPAAAPCGNYSTHFKARIAPLLSALSETLSTTQSGTQ